MANHQHSIHIIGESKRMPWAVYRKLKNLLNCYLGRVTLNIVRHCTTRVYTYNTNTIQIVKCNILSKNNLIEFDKKNYVFLTFVFIEENFCNDLSIHQ